MHVVFVARHRRAFFCVLFATASTSAEAQTDYFNTDRARPLHVQDARAVERYALELLFAPVHWSGLAGSAGHWTLEPELTYGILPRTQLALGASIVHMPGAAGGATGAGSLHLSLLHALNVETLGVPAMAITASYVAPVGPFGPHRGFPSVGLATTRTFSSGRVHLNGDVTLGSAVAADDGVWNLRRAVGLDEVSHWTTGIAIDRPLSLRSLLLAAELVARKPIREGAEVMWQGGAGVRWQLDPRWVLDAGVARSLRDDREWSITLGAARALGLVNFNPSRP
jgi:hypothetical protein